MKLRYLSSTNVRHMAELRQCRGQFTRLQQTKGHFRIIQDSAEKVLCGAIKHVVKVLKCYNQRVIDSVNVKIKLLLPTALSRLSNPQVSSQRMVKSKNKR